MMDAPVVYDFADVPQGNETVVRAVLIAVTGRFPLVLGCVEDLAAAESIARAAAQLGTMAGEEWVASRQASRQAREPVLWVVQPAARSTTPPMRAEVSTLSGDRPYGVTSARLLEEVRAARRWQARRQPWMPGLYEAELRAHLDRDAVSIYDSAVERVTYWTGEEQRAVLRVARTVADLGGHGGVRAVDVAEAMHYFLREAQGG
jgi:hypothetical protein